MKTKIAAAIYSSRIIKAGALLADTKAVLFHWDESLTTRENMDRLIRGNLLGKASRSRAEDILAALFRRYLQHADTRRGVATLVRGRLAGDSVDAILYFHTARADCLLHDTVTQFLAERYRGGRRDVTVEELEHQLIDWMREGKTKGQWSKQTASRIAQGLLATLRDFGILEGAVNKRLAPIHLPIAAFAYIAFCLSREQPSGERLIHHPEWQLFFLFPETVERMFMEAHQRGLLEYYAAGPVIRLSFPAESREEYARVIAQRSN